MIPLFKVFTHKDVPEKLRHVFNSGFIGEGAGVKRFESAISAFLNIGINNFPIVTTNSCTSALKLAFRLKFPPKSRVLITPLTCFATTAALIASGMEPVWVDIDPTTLHVNIEDLRAKLDPTIGGICLIDFAGRPPDYRAIREVTDLPIVEDAAHAIGAYYEGYRLGSAHIQQYYNVTTCFSFQAVKTLTTGDGGAIALYDLEEQNRARRLRWYGMDRTLDREQDIYEVGDKLHMNDIAAEIGLANLPEVVAMIDRQRGNCSYYRSVLSDISLHLGDGIGSSDWLFPIFVKDRYAFERKMAERGVAASPAHRRNDTQPCVRQHSVPLPLMDYVEGHMTCIPCGWWVSNADREYIANSVRESL